ncbi:hypothetical protein GEMRC1_011450 [Eukaryota sp. GEM-RC1]
MIRLLNFYVVHLTGFIVLGLIGGILLFIVSSLSLINSFFTSYSAITVTGLLPYDFSTMSIAFQLITLILIQAGSVSLWTLVPVVVRRRYLMQRFNEVVIPQEFDRSHLNPPTEKGVPLYLYSIEHWAMSRLIVNVLLYIGFWYLFGMTSLLIRFLSSPASRAMASTVGGFGYWTVFHVISAFNNAGFALFATSLEPFNRDPFIMIPLSFLIIAGQTGFPILLRLFIVIRSKFSRFAPVHSFLLNHGREIYTHLFSRVETLWLSFGGLSSLFSSLLSLLFLTLDLSQVPSFLRYLTSTS